MVNKLKEFSNGSKIHPIGIGTWGIGGGIMASNKNDEEEIAAIRYSVKKGQNHIDTAELYGSGHSEEIVGQAIKVVERKKLFIASKIWSNNAQKENIPKATEAMLKRLGTDYLDLLYIHACWDEHEIENYLGGLNDAQDKGLTKAIGVSNFNLRQLKKAVKVSKHKIIAIQNHYNLVHQNEVDKDMKAYCLENNIMIVAYTPLEGLAWNLKVKKIAKKYNKIPAQIAINWLISKDNVVTIPKAVDKKHIDENLGAMDFEIEKSDLVSLNKS